MSPARALTRGSSRPGPLALPTSNSSELAHPLGLARGPGDAALLQDASRQLLAQKSRAAGDHHLHVVSVPCPMTLCERKCAQIGLHSLCCAAMAGSERDLRLQGCPDHPGHRRRRGPGGPPPQNQPRPGVLRRRRRAGAAWAWAAWPTIRGRSTGSPSPARSRSPSSPTWASSSCCSSSAWNCRCAACSPCAAWCSGWAGCRAC